MQVRHPAHDPADQGERGRVVNLGGAAVKQLAQVAERREPGDGAAAHGAEAPNGGGTGGSVRAGQRRTPPTAEAVRRAAWGTDKVIGT